MWHLLMNLLIITILWKFHPFVKELMGNVDKKNQFGGIFFFSVGIVHIVKDIIISTLERIIFFFLSIDFVYRGIN